MPRRQRVCCNIQCGRREPKDHPSCRAIRIHPILRVWMRAPRKTPTGPWSYRMRAENGTYTQPVSLHILGLVHRGNSGRRPRSCLISKELLNRWCESTSAHSGSQRKRTLKAAPGITRPFASRGMKICYSLCIIPLDDKHIQPRGSYRVKKTSVLHPSGSCSWKQWYMSVGHT